MRDNFMRVEGPKPDFPESECPLLIVGSGRGMWHDLALYCLFHKRSHVMLVNRAIVDFKGPEFLEVKHAVCLDENCVELYRQIRQRIRRVDDDIELTHACGGKCDVRWIFDIKPGDRPNDSGARQGMPEVYVQTGGIYIGKVEEFLEEKDLYMEPMIPYITTREKGIDIDSEMEFRLAEMIYDKEVG
jgi:hypothetical protein